MKNFTAIWLGLLVTGIIAGMAGLLLLVLHQPPNRSPVVPAAAPAAPEPAAPRRHGAWIDEIVFTAEADKGKVVNQIESGRFDLFAAAVSNPVIYQRIRNSAKTDYALSYGGTVELTMNTAEFTDREQLNPFHNRRLREAMNWLLDRNYIATELFGGLATPRYLHISTVLPDYARLAESARTLELKYRYDAVRAEAIITEEMHRLGAVKENGQWRYREAPVELKILIRTEDARRELGDYVSNLMERLGFRVQRIYRTAAEASRIWIASDPAAGRWHLYTGGWVSVVINRDLAGDLDQFYTPRGRPEPLWQSYTPDPELDELAERLQRRDYETWDERQTMMARGLDLAMREATRIWLIDQKNIWPHAANVAFAADLAAGFGGSALWPYTLRFTDRVGGRMVIGVPNLLTEPWNPVAGTNWIFDRMITRALGDPTVLPDPFTGLYHPQRIQKAEVTIQKNIPINHTLDWVRLSRAEEITVPEDAWIDWNRTDGRFVTVAEKHPDGITARTKTRVVYEDRFLHRKWHDGTQMSMADIILPWILAFERADEESPLFDRSVVPIFQSFKTHFRGWRIQSENPLEITIYSDQIFPDAEWIVGARAPGISAWHVLALGILAEQEGTLAFSSDKADQLAVEWMNLVSGPSLTVLDRNLVRARRETWIPFPEFLADYLTSTEVSERYQALAEWRSDKGHFWVGNGPFYLQAARPLEKSVVLRRFADFPDSADKWLQFGDPEIPQLELSGPEIVRAGQEPVFQLRITYDHQAYPAANLERIGFMVFDSQDQLVLEGEIDPEDQHQEGLWKITIPADQIAGLPAGAFSLEAAVTSNRVALPSFASRAFAFLGRPGQATSQ